MRQPFEQEPQAARIGARRRRADDGGDVVGVDRPEEGVQHAEVDAFPLQREFEVAAQGRRGGMARREHSPLIGGDRMVSFRDGGQHGGKRDGKAVARDERGVSGWGARFGEGNAAKIHQGLRNNITHDHFPRKSSTRVGRHLRPCNANIIHVVRKRFSAGRRVRKIYPTNQEGILPPRWRQGLSCFVGAKALAREITDVR